MFDPSWCAGRAGFSTRKGQAAGGPHAARCTPPAVPLGYSTYAELLGAFVSVKEAAVTFCDYTINKKKLQTAAASRSAETTDTSRLLLTSTDRLAVVRPEAPAAGSGPNTSHFKGPSGLHSVWEPGSVSKTSPQSRGPDQDQDQDPDPDLQTSSLDKLKPAGSQSRSQRVLSPPPRIKYIYTRHISLRLTTRRRPTEPRRRTERAPSRTSRDRTGGAAFRVGGSSRGHVSDRLESLASQMIVSHSSG